MLKTASPNQPTALSARTKALEIADSIQYLLDSGILYEINRTIMHPTGLSLSARSGGLTLTDHSRNPVVVFDESSLKIGDQKYKAYLKEKGIAATLARREKLGYVVQVRQSHGR